MTWPNGTATEETIKALSAKLTATEARLAEAVAVLKQVNGCRDGLCAECQYKLDAFLRPADSATEGDKP